MGKIVQGDRGEFGIEGGDESLTSGFVAVNYRWDTTSGATEGAFFVAPRDYVVKGIAVRRTAGSSDTSANLSVVKAASGSALDSTATLLHSAAIVTAGSANTNASVTMSTNKATLALPAGSALGVSFVGTIGASVGCVTVVLSPA